MVGCYTVSSKKFVTLFFVLSLFAFCILPPNAFAASYEFEADLMIEDSDGTSSQTKNDTAASSGQYFLYNSNAVDEFVTFSIPVNPKGVYSLDLQYHLSQYRGTFIVEVADELLGTYTQIGTMDTIVSSGSSFPTLSMSTTFLTAGTKYLRFKATGAGSAGNEKMGLDKIDVVKTADIAGPAERQATTFNSNTAGGGISVNEPSNTAQGDLLVAVQVNNKSSVPNLNSGWTNIQSGGNGANRQRVSYIVRGSSAPDLTFPCGQSTHPCTVSVTRYTGVDTTNPIHVSALQGDDDTSDTTVTCPSVTTTVGNTLVQYYETDRKNAGATSFATATVAEDISPLSGQSITLGEKTQVTAGATGAELATNTGSGAVMNCTTVAITPTASSGSNNPPTVMNPGSLMDTEGDSVSLQIQASDPDAGDSLTYSATDLPIGLSIDSSTGLISGTASTADTYNTVITVADGNGGGDSASFTWTVNENVVAGTPDFYVATTGSDSNSGSQTAPLKTLSKAVQLASNGDIIKMEVGEYDLGSSALTISKNLTIVGVVPDETILTGKTIDVDTAVEFYNLGFDDFSARQAITIIGNNGDTIDGFHVENCHFTAMRGGIRMDNFEGSFINATVKNSLFKDLTHTGKSVVGVSFAHQSNNDVKDIYIINNNFDNLDSTNSGASAIRVGDNSSRDNTTNIHIEDNDIKNIHASCVDDDGDGEYPQAHGIKVFGEYVDVLRNTVKDLNVCLDHEAINLKASYSQIIDNTVHNGGAVSQEGDILIKATSPDINVNNLIKDNTITNDLAYSQSQSRWRLANGINIYGESIIRNNTISKYNCRSGIHSNGQQGQNVTIDDNTVDLYGCLYGISPRNNANPAVITVEDNTIRFDSTDDEVDAINTQGSATYNINNNTICFSCL